MLHCLLVLHRFVVLDGGDVALVAPGRSARARGGVTAAAAPSAIAPLTAAVASAGTAIGLLIRISLPS